MIHLTDWLMKRSHWRVLTWGLVAGILFCTMWPFNPLAANHVQWIPGERGIVFNGNGIAWTAPASQTKGTNGKAASLEVLLRTPDVNGVHTILNVYAPGNPNQFLFRQWTDGLIVSDAWLAGGKTRSAKFDVDHAFQPGNLILMTLTSDGKQTTVYLNAKKAKSFAHFVLSELDLSGQIVVGNSASDYEPWNGELKGLAIYERALTAAEVEKHYQDWLGAGTDVDGAQAHYNFSEGSGKIARDIGSAGVPLEIPAMFRLPHKRFLKPIREEWKSNDYVWDGIVNIIGFLPFGIALGGYLRHRHGAFPSILATTVAGGIFSLLIEMTQSLIPTRSSGQTDIITNTLGALIGAVLVSVWLDRTQLFTGTAGADKERRVA